MLRNLYPQLMMIHQNGHELFKKPNRNDNSGEAQELKKEEPPSCRNIRKKKEKKKKGKKERKMEKRGKKRSSRLAKADFWVFWFFGPLAIKT